MNLFDQFDAALDEQTINLPLSNAEPGTPIKTQEDIEREWLQQRWGKFTASEAYKLMTYKDKDELPKGVLTYIMKKVAESLTEFRVTPFITDAMQWGLMHEPEAVDAFVDKTGLVVTHCKDGQCFIDKGYFGGTPDGLIPSEFSGLEVKCPNSETHLGYLQIKTASDLKQAAPDYYWQCMSLMMITASLHWYFISYDPRFKNERLKLHIAKIAADPGDISRLRKRLALADIYKNQIIENINT